MPQLLIVGEDQLCCALAERIVGHALPDWTPAAPSIDKGGVTKLRAGLPRYENQARHVQPVLCVADTDGECAVEWLRRWRPPDATPKLVVRLAVPEAESWVLADRAGFAACMQVPASRIARAVDELPDPKLHVLQLVRRSRRRVLREEMVSATDPDKQGSGYNLHLCRFVRTAWDVAEARQASPSLDRAVRGVQALTE